MNRSGNQQLTFTPTDESVTFWHRRRCLPASRRVVCHCQVWRPITHCEKSALMITPDAAEINRRHSRGVSAGQRLPAQHDENYPVPSSGMQLRVDAVVAMAEYSSVSDTVNLPPETRRRCVRRWQYIFALNMASSRLPR